MENDNPYGQTRTNPSPGGHKRRGYGGLIFLFSLCTILVLGLGYGLRSLMPAWANTGSKQLSQALPEPEERPLDVGNGSADAFLGYLSSAPAFPEEGPITVDDDWFPVAYDEIYENSERYYGRDITLGGFVLHQDDLAEGEFLIGRYLLWCCAADKYFIGFLAHSDGPRPPEFSSWVLQGTIKSRIYINPENGKQFTVPAIAVRGMTRYDGLPQSVFPIPPSR